MFLHCLAVGIFSPVFHIKAAAAPFGHLRITLLALPAAQRALPSTASVFCMDFL